MKIVMVSGYFNPIHIGHIDYLVAARALGDSLFVIINSDHQVGIKGSVPFMPEDERMAIVNALRCVDGVALAVDTDGTCCATIRQLHSVWKDPDAQFIWANGGDRTKDNMPEDAVCAELGIEVAFGVGGQKVQSSSALIAAARA